jgi:hypothetical protein
MWCHNPKDDNMNNVTHYGSLVKGLESISRSSVQVPDNNSSNYRELTLHVTLILAQPLGMYEIWFIWYQHNRRHSQNTITEKTFSLVIQACIWAMFHAHGQRLLSVNILTMRSLNIRCQHLNWIKMTHDRSIWWECTQLWSALQVPHNHPSSAQGGYSVNYMSWEGGKWWMVKNVVMIYFK